MKILNFGLPRTRSSYLTDILSQNYHLVNVFEPYHLPAQDKIKKQTIKVKQDQRTKTRWEDYCKLTANITNDLTQMDNFICKIFPTALYNNFDLITEDQYEFKYDASNSMDLLTSHNVNMYDKIYITYRESKVDLFCSFLQGVKHETFLYTEKNKSLIKFHTPKNCDMSYNIIEAITLSLNLKLFDIYFKKLRTFNNVEILEYNDIPCYLNTTFPNIKSIYIDSKIDYKNKIKNYSDIEKDFNRVYEKVSVEVLS